MENQELLKALNISSGKGILPDVNLAEITLLAGDGSTRQYWRNKFGNDSVIACLDPTENRQAMVRNTLSVFKAYQENDIRVPEIYDYNIELGYILEEDLGDKSLNSFLSQIASVPQEYALYQKVLDQLIHIHSISTERYENIAFTQASFDIEKLMWEVNFSITHFLEGHLKAVVSENEKKLIQDSYLIICQKLAEQKRVVTHRDFHSRNIMMKNQDLFIIDFQDCRMGIPQYDLVSLLDDCYYKIHSENYFRLKRYYWDKFLSQRKLQGSWDEFIYFYDLMMIQRTFKALGSFGYISKVKNDIKFVRYIGYSFENLRSTLAKYSEFAPLRKILAGFYYGA